MKETNIEVLIIPDVHGRTFWIDALTQFPINSYPDLQIIFLGDYLDPYESYEGISQETAFNNFKCILDIAKKDPRVTLLMGNHDWHYFVNLDTCRMDYTRESKIRKLFVKNLSKFKLYKVIEINNTKYLFTHAGITQKWLNDISDIATYEFEKWNPGEPNSTNYVDPETDKDYKWIKELSKIKDTYNFELLEKCLQNYDNNFYTCIISMISRDRGGWYPHGSLIWADVDEHLYSEDIQGFYQIFGHTMTYPNGPRDYAISPFKHNWAMIDASQAFIIDSNNNLLPLNRS
jgi:predicted MPP superfamily phosphohydrolase